MSRELALALGAAALAAGAWYVARRYGLGFSDGRPTGPVELVQVQGVEVPASVAPRVLRMLEDSRRAGVPLQLNSAFRGLGKQTWLWLQLQLGMRADPVAKPGYSNHQRGEPEKKRGPALDIQVHRSTESAEFRWLKANAHRYGLSPVGLGFGEPWHWELLEE